MLNKTEIGSVIVLAATRLFINYIKYQFLIGSVIFSLFVLLFITLSINPTYSFSFLQHFSFINPMFNAESFSMGIKEVMQIFLVASFFLMIFIALIKIALKKIFGYAPRLTLKLKVISFFVIITLAYAIASLIVAFSDSLDNGFYLIFIIFYIISLISSVGYFLLDALLDKIPPILKK